MRTSAAIILIAVAVINALIAVGLDLGTMRARVQVATRHATLLNTGGSMLHQPSPDLGFVTQEDLKTCPEKVRQQYEELATYAYGLTDPDRHWPTYVSLVVSVCLGISGVMNLKGTTAKKDQT